MATVRAPDSRSTGDSAKTIESVSREGPKVDQKSDATISIGRGKSEGGRTLRDTSTVEVIDLENQHRSIKRLAELKSEECEIYKLLDRRLRSSISQSKGVSPKPSAVTAKVSTVDASKEARASPQPKPIVKSTHKVLPATTPAPKAKPAPQVQKAAPAVYKVPPAVKRPPSPRPISPKQMPARPTSPRAVRQPRAVSPGRPIARAMTPTRPMARRAVRTPPPRPGYRSLSPRPYRPASPRPPSRRPAYQAYHVATPPPPQVIVERYFQRPSQKKRTYPPTKLIPLTYAGSLWSVFCLYALAKSVPTSPGT